MSVVVPARIECGELGHTMHGEEVCATSPGGGDSGGEMVKIEEGVKKMEIAFLLTTTKEPKGAPGTPAESSARYQCRHCDMRFAYKGKLLYHEMQHGERLGLQVCDECEMAFQDKCLLRNHIKCVHVRKRRFKCSQCDLTFYFKKDLPKHVSAVHDKLRPFACPTCDKKFGKKEHVKRHLRLVHRTTEADVKQEDTPPS